MAKKIKKETELSVLREIRDYLKGGGVSISNPTNVRFIRNSDGSFTDKQLSIIWAKEDFPEKMSFIGAQEACKALGKGWRVASDKEMESLIDRSKYNPAIISDAQILGLKTDDWYWTNVPYAGSSDSAWIVGFRYGSMSCDVKGSNNYVWPVRASQ